ncbi:uncharacterized protein CDAR_405741 [Caerostris darwini]|uniref:Chitin-binding type-2 domain-containing protein n=1 Tax=Caerostris darwini TaxID=1538125 RepID=A0AAV4X3P1_9ARAC|nr:uncharacterized protein CDAR_405741 [Caerostris darwini]
MPGANIPICMTARNAVCADGSDVVEHGYTCPKTWGSFRFPKDCSKYYECLQKQPSVRTCKKDHLFDDKRNRCSPKQFVRCGSRYNPYEVATSVQPETKPVTLTKHDNKLSSSNDNIAVSTVKEDFIKEQYSSAVPEVNSFSNKASNDYIGISTMSAVKEDLIEEQQSSAIPEVNSFAHKDQLATNTPVPSKYRLLTGEILSVSSVSESKESTVTLSPKDDIVKGSSATEQEIERQQTEMTTDSELKDLSSSNEFIEVSTATGKGEIEVSSQGPISKKTEISNEINVQKFAAESVTKSAEEIQNSSEFPEVTTTSADRKVECPPDDSRCVVDKSGRIIRCPAGVNNLQSHPWDEVQFLDCTESKIHIYSCPPGLIFNPRLKRCLRKFIIRI